MRKRQKKKKKREKNLCLERDLNPRPSDYKFCTLPAKLKLQSAITPVKFNGFFSKVNLLIIPYQLTKFQASSLNTLRYPADKIFFQKKSKGHNYKRGDNSEKKKTRVSYFYEESTYEISRLALTVKKLQ